MDDDMIYWPYAQDPESLFEEIASLREKVEELELELAKQRNALGGKSIYWYIAEVNRFQEMQNAKEEKQ